MKLKQGVFLLSLLALSACGSSSSTTDPATTTAGNEDSQPTVPDPSDIMSDDDITDTTDITAGTQTTLTWTVDGVQREALVSVPPTVAGVKYPLIFAFHGHGGTSKGTARQMKLQNLWPEAIVVYPQGLPIAPFDNPEGNARPGWQYEAGYLNDRDLKFVDAMLMTLKQNYTVDDTRIYATGFSNGANFSYLLWSERGTTFAAFGVVAGFISTSMHPTPARPVLVIAGETDTTCPFSDQLLAIETDRQIDSATGPGQSCGPICTDYTSTTQTPVQTFIHPDGHVYPPWAGQAVVDFFKAHNL